MKKIAFLLILITSSYNLKAQQRVVTTGVPFLMVAADARAGGMADMGVASSADAFSQQYNPAKYAFSEKKHGFSVSYTPYLTTIANDISLGQLNYFNRFNERSAFATSFRYFSLGDIQLTDEGGNEIAIVSPNEFAFDLSYSLKLSERFSMAVAGRYIRSSLKVPSGLGDASPASSFAVDIAAFYQSEEIAFNDFNGRFRAGLNLQNMGPKINYSNDKLDENGNFLPSNLRLGAGFDFILDDYNKITALGEVTKLMVPTPKVSSSSGEISGEDMNGDGVLDSNDLDLARAELRSTSWTSGIFKSFGDAPDGFSEELKEFTWALGAEYAYQDSFSLRTGYFHESEDKGARKFFTLGAGFKYNIVKIDVSYLFSASKVKNPLENTLRFSLTFNFGDSYDEL